MRAPLWAGGEVEMDESYFGPRRVRGKRGRGAGGKIPVSGLYKRGQSAKLNVVKSCSKQELMPITTGCVREGTDVCTDGWRACDRLVPKGEEYHCIHHRENQFARGKNHGNGIESFWSYAKFRFRKLRGVRQDRFLLHLKECEWRFDRHRSILYPLLLSLFRKSPLSATEDPSELFRVKRFAADDRVDERLEAVVVFL